MGYLPTRNPSNRCQFAAPGGGICGARPHQPYATFCAHHAGIRRTNTPQRATVPTVAPSAPSATDGDRAGGAIVLTPPQAIAIAGRVAAAESRAVAAESEVARLRAAERARMERLFVEGARERAAAAAERRHRTLLSHTSAGRAINVAETGRPEPLPAGLSEARRRELLALTATGRELLAAESAALRGGAGAARP